MDATKRARLEKSGWRVGSAEEFLGLSSEEAALIALKLVLSEGLRKRRTSVGLTQTELARRLGSSQSRVAKMEAADSTVSVDLLVRAYLALGATPKEIAQTIGKAS
jgi:hypothetical protein